MTQKNILFYDLETNGLDYYTTGIMQITILDITGTILLNEYVYPFDKRIDGTEIHHITEETLRINNAIETPELLVRMKNVIRDKYNRDPVYLVAYNNFGYDQNILENNFKVCNIKMPLNWLFIDIFPIIKEMFPDMKPNYKLKTIYENLFCPTDNLDFHSSLTDTKCLYEIYNAIKDIDYLIEKYTRPSITNKDYMNLAICTFRGYNRYMELEIKKINTIGDMYNLFKNVNFDKNAFDFYLRNSAGIYSNYFINDTIKQLNFMKYLCE